MARRRRVRVRLLRAHIHAGERLSPGRVLWVRPDQAEWLAALGVAEPVRGRIRQHKE